MIENVVGRETAATGKIISFEKLKVEFPDGRRADRDIVRHPGGCVIIPTDDNNNIYLVKQYRVAFEDDILELPAGKLEKGEDPLICARRELKEETGISAETIRHVTSIYSSPGFCDEVIHIFFAQNIKVEDPEPDEDEFVQTVKIPLGELANMVWRGEVNDAKTVAGVLMAERLLKG